MRRMIRIEPFELYSVVTGTIRLDGGAMFGVVPKVLWEKVVDGDDLNRIALATRTLLAIDRARERVILVDTGCGTKWAPEQLKRYAISYDPEAITRALEQVGLAPDAVTDVVVTHLHFDHNGGLTDWFDDPHGPVKLRYPRARHWIHRDHWQHACQPDRKDRASFLTQDFLALADADVLQFVDGDQPPPPFEGVEWLVAHGHTPAQLLPIFGTGDQRLLFVGDLVPTIAHLRLTWGMAYDRQPVTTIAEKEAVFRRCFDSGLLLAFPHDPTIGGVSIDGTVDRPIVASTLSV